MSDDFLIIDGDRVPVTDITVESATGRVATLAAPAFAARFEGSINVADWDALVDSINRAEWRRLLRVCRLVRNTWAWATFAAEYRWYRRQGHVPGVALRHVIELLAELQELRSQNQTAPPE